MSWFNANSQWRAPVTVNNIGGASTIDVAITIPSDWGAFWSNVATNGHDIKVCDSDGTTLLTWSRDTWDHAARSAILEVNDWTPDSADATVILYLYWGESSPTDTASSFTVSSAKIGTVLACRPAPGSVIIRAESPPVGEDVPRSRYAWPPGQSGWIGFDVTEHLKRQAVPLNGSADLETIAFVTVATRNDGSAFNSGNTPANTRCSEYDGRTIVYMWVTGSVNDADYIDEITVTTSYSRVLLFPALRIAQTAEET